MFKSELLDTICANSYRNFHVKGFDYLYLKRTPEHTQKIYFFGENLDDLPELVIPHDHRYPFDTTVLSGVVRNKVFWEAGDDQAAPANAGWEKYDRFSYMTPLNGGDGFKWEDETFLRLAATPTYCQGKTYMSQAKAVHTLAILDEGTVICLDQYEDVVPIDQPTTAFRPVGSREPPNLDGLYDRMDPDYAIGLLIRLAQLGAG